MIFKDFSPLKAMTSVLGIFVLGLFLSSYERTSGTDEFALAMVCIAFICSLFFFMALVFEAVPNTKQWLRIDMTYHAVMVPLLAFAMILMLINVISLNSLKRPSKKIIALRSLALIFNFFNIIAYGLEVFRVKRIEKNMNEAYREPDVEIRVIENCVTP